jgi:hypothetical protein
VRDISLITSKFDAIRAAKNFRRGIDFALCPTGLGTQKIPKNESEHGQENDKYGPDHFLSGIRTALENIHDGPHIGDQNDDSE